MNYLVVIACVAQITSCPIPSGMKVYYKAASIKQCEKEARMLVIGLGYNDKDFTIRCRDH